MNEKEDAIRLANKVLETPHRDPDDDLSMMSRQFLRQTEMLNQARQCLGFFASVIKSGESWTDTCEREYQLALGKTSAAAPSPGEPAAQTRQDPASP